MRRPNLIILLGTFLLATSAVSQQNPTVIDAVHRGHLVGHEQDGVEAVRAALAAGDNVNESDESGWTPLMYAALECRDNIVKLLLNKGANVNARSHSTGKGFLDTGQTPLLIASGCFIARRRAQLAPKRHMPPDYAVYELSAPGKMVNDLLAHGADLKVADIYGRTPLMMAAMQSWTEVIKELLRAQVDVNAHDREGRLAIDYADPADEQSTALLKAAGSAKPTGHSGRTVCDAERALSVEIVDCIAGQQLSGAVKKFQNEHALAVTGELDAPTLKALGVRQ
jgi:Ankyrin repeats (3 copies)/Ankyrin repeats (many copies)/Putative peptidoglycan binding domain